MACARSEVDNLRGNGTCDERPHLWVAPSAVPYFRLILSARE
jgi:hypothetical protein